MNFLSLDLTLASTRYARFLLDKRYKVSVGGYFRLNRQL